MTSPIPTLPPRFTIDGYTIISVIETGGNYVLYEALSPKGLQVKLREFYPQAICSRAPHSFAVEFSTNSQEELNQYKAAFDVQFSQGASTTIQVNGTYFMVYGLPVASPARAPLAPIKMPKKKSSVGATPFVILGLFGGLAYLMYTLLYQEPPTAPEKPKPVAVENKPKPKPKPPTIKPVAPVIPDVVIEDNTPEPEIIPEEEPEVVSHEPSDDLIGLKKKAIEEIQKCSSGITKRATDAYTAYAEKAVREYITQRGGALSPAFEAWLKATKLNKEVFASVYPPDPSVATNVAMLVEEFGEKAKEYNQLVLAMAVARRSFGMGSFDIGRQGRFGDGKGTLNNLRSAGTIPLPCDLYIAGKDPVNYFGPNPAIVDEETYLRVEKYLQDNKLTPKQVWNDSRKALYAVGNGNMEKRDQLKPYLYEYMYRNGMLKRKRDSYPTAFEYFAFLTDKYENYKRLKDSDHKRVSWPGVALDVTQWPIMMALAETRPLREAESVWSRYLGFGKDKEDFPTTRIIGYGHYRRDDDKEAPVDFSFDPDGDWSSDSFERMVHCGGVCGTMSLIARTTFISLGVPAAPAGQPGHGNLMTTVYDGNGCRLEVGHSVDTLKVTNGPWYFEDSKAPRTGMAEYQTGLALSMNMDYEDFITSRVAMNAYKLLNDESSDNSDLNTKLLDRIIKINPFNAEAWHLRYELSDKDFLATINLVDVLRKAIPNNNSVGRYWQRKGYHKEVGKASKNAKEILQRQASEYVNVISAAWTEQALKSGKSYDRIKWSDIRKWYKSEQKDNSYAETTEALQTALVKERGVETIKAEVDRDFKKMVQADKDSQKKNKRKKRKDRNPINQEEMGINLIALSKEMPQKEFNEWLKSMLDEIPDTLKYSPKNPVENKIQPFYDELTKQYFVVADSSEKNRIKEDMKRVDTELMEKLKKTTYKHTTERD